MARSATNRISRESPDQRLRKVHPSIRRLTDCQRTAPWGPASVHLQTFITIRADAILERSQNLWPTQKSLPYHWHFSFHVSSAIGNQTLRPRRCEDELFMLTTFKYRQNASGVLQALWTITYLLRLAASWRCLKNPRSSTWLQVSRFRLDFTIYWASLGAQTVKRLPPIRETRVPSLGREDPLEKEMAPHSRTLAWKIPWTEVPGSSVHGIAKSRTRLSNFTSLFTLYKLMKP